MTGGFDNATGIPSNPLHGRAIIDRIVAKHSLTFARTLMTADLQAIQAVIPAEPETGATNDEILEYAMQVAVQQYLQRRIKDLGDQLEKL